MKPDDGRSVANRPLDALPMRRRQFLLSALGGAAAVAGSTLSAGPAHAEVEFQELYDAARKEGEMTWYVSFYGQEVAQTTVDAFVKKYPGLKVAAVRRTTGSTFQRINQDLRASANLASVLTMSGIADYYDQLKRGGHLAPYTPQNAAKLDKSVQSTIDPDFVYPMAGGLMVIAYNSQKLTADQAPKSWTDLTDPKWKDKLALSHPAFSGFDAALDVALMREKGWDYFVKINKNNPLIQRSTFDTITAINAGERLVASMPDTVAIESAAKGNPVAVLYPSDGSILIPGLTAIMKGAPQPNTAKLFTEFLLGTEHAKILADVHYVSVRPEVVTKLPTGQNLTDIPLIAIQPSAELGKDLKTVVEKWRDLFG
jgi:iron(III) transport system substrate-binding protein